MNAEDAITMRRMTGCDGLMIARGAMGNPWLFAEIIAAMQGQRFEPPSLRQRVQTALSQMEQMIAEKGERVGFAEAKKQMAWYIHGVSGAAEARGRIMSAAGPSEVERGLRELSER